MKKKSTVPFRAGFIAVVGKPNVGKSTLVNAIVGKKVAITSPKPQTTRQRILGVKTTENLQMIFVDTPGLTVPKHLLGKSMVKHSQEALVDCDVCLFMVQATHRKPMEQDWWALKVLQQGLKHRDPAPPIFLVMNKVDQVKDKGDLLPTIETYSKLASWTEIFPISALKKENLEPLVEAMKARMPENPPFYGKEDEEIVDENFQISEIIREKILYCIQEEVPHGVAIAVEEKRLGKDKKTFYVRATIYVEREAHKAILVGKDGGMLKKIGMMARKDLSRLKNQPVFLDLWVKVKENWQDRPELLTLFGYS